LQVFNQRNDLNSHFFHDGADLFVLVEHVDEVVDDFGGGHDVFHAFEEDAFGGADDGAEGFEEPGVIKVFDVFDEVETLGEEFHVGVEGGLPEFGLFGELVGFDEFEDFDKMRGDGVVERVVFGGNFEVGIPTLRGDGLVVLSEVEFVDGLGKFVGVSLGIIFMDLCEEDFDGFGWAVVGVLGLHGMII
jgi:hypothetical protein